MILSSPKSSTDGFMKLRSCGVYLALEGDGSLVALLRMVFVEVDGLSFFNGVVGVMDAKLTLLSLESAEFEGEELKAFAQPCSLEELDADAERFKPGSIVDVSAGGLVLSVNIPSVLLKSPLA
ncbi:hypothetical protein WICPIJ_006102 [Wickerhamomyces pijperi]|uniref:Uncharacterized protein n=1 Tax=Wickerhamomyces pijperi TaxID=599730 RepID=A0A9P8Q4N2_WICPI|nr:hypothetical protein WICPIJ_006102 [Wickerhamomyces pijperi]